MLIPYIEWKHISKDNTVTNLNRRWRRNCLLCMRSTNTGSTFVPAPFRGLFWLPDGRTGTLACVLSMAGLSSLGHRQECLCYPTSPIDRAAGFFYCVASSEGVGDSFRPLSGGLDLFHEFS